MTTPVTPPEPVPTTGRTLILLRHGKSGYPDGVEDHDRPLADRGNNQAAEAGRWIRLYQPPVEQVICSTALRTRQTLQATGLSAPVRFAAEIYDATAGEVLEQVAGTDAAVRTLLVVGHAPGLPTLSSVLATPESNFEALSDLQSRFPTCALAVFAVPGDWAELAGSGAALTAFHIAGARP